MAYQKTEYKNNEQPALSAKNLNKNENAIKQQSLWKKLACLEDATYILNMEDYALEEGSFLAVYFEAALDETKKLIIQFNGIDYEAYTSQKQYFGSDVREQMILLCFKDDHFELFSSQSSRTSKQIGEVGVIYSDEAPYNCKIIDGFEWNRKEYPKLWEYAQKEINKGNQLFTEGNGSTTFKVLQPNFPVSKSNEAEFNILGKQAGEKIHTLTTEEMPNHNHNLYSGYGSGGGYGYDAIIFGQDLSDRNYKVSGTGGIAFIQNTGGNQPHNNLPPYTVVNFYICYDHEAVVSGARNLNQEVQDLNKEIVKTQKRYLIDAHHSEHGLLWNLYSDGWYEQYDVSSIASIPASSSIENTFAIRKKLKNTSYQCQVSLRSGGNNYASTSSFASILEPEKARIYCWNNSGIPAENLWFNTQIVGYVDPSVLESYNL